MISGPVPTLPQLGCSGRRQRCLHLKLWYKNWMKHALDY